MEVAMPDCPDREQCTLHAQPCRSVAHLLVLCSDVLNLLRFLKDAQLGLLLALCNFAHPGLCSHCSQHAPHPCFHSFNQSFMCALI